MSDSKQKYKHYLCCSKCSFAFSIDSPESNNTKIGFDKMKCPICSKPVQLNPTMLNVSGKLSLENQSRMNAEASREAIRMANEMKRSDADTGVGKLVPVTSTQKGKNYGKTEMLPEKTIKSIEEKIKPELEGI